MLVLMSVHHLCVEFGVMGITQLQNNAANWHIQTNHEATEMHKEQEHCRWPAAGTSKGHHCEGTIFQKSMFPIHVWLRNCLVNTETHVAKGT